MRRSKLTLQRRLVLFLIVVYSAIVLIAIVVSFRKSMNDLKTEVDNQVIENALKIQIKLNTAFATTRTLGHTLEAYPSLTETSRRSAYSEMLQNEINKNADFHSMWSAWEPFSIDNLDTMYNKSGASGRFVVDFEKQAEQAFAVPLSGTSESILLSADYYIQAHDRRKELIYYPKEYNVSDEDNAREHIKLTYPIINTGKFVGVLGADLNIGMLHSTLAGMNVMGYSSAFLVSADGMVVDHNDARFVGKGIEEIFSEEGVKQAISEKIASGGLFMLNLQANDSKKGSYCSFVGFPVGQTSTNWALGFSVPRSAFFWLALQYNLWLIILSILGLFLVYFLSKRLSDYVKKALSDANTVLKSLSLGDINVEQVKTFDYHDDEINVTESLNKVIEGLRKTNHFALEIGKGNLDAEFEMLSEKDALGKSLLDMRESLKVSQQHEIERKIEDEKRNWATNGIAKFSEILRLNNDNLKELTYNVISNLVDYLGANQGGIFILNDNQGEENHLELAASCAFNRRKFLERRIEIGEGLVGRCVQEALTIYLKEIPENYVEITSGLGGASPKSLLLVPLKLNDKVFGVIELASFFEIEPYKIEFVEKIGETIASTFSNVKINISTASLLERFQQQAEEMKAQEEELRQNLEELQSTQEELHRQMLENSKAQEVLIKNNALLDSIMNNLPEFIYFKDLNSKFIRISQSMLKLFPYDSIDEMIGKSDFDFHKREAAQVFYEEEQEIIRSGKGYIDNIVQEKLSNGVEQWVSTTKMPLYDTSGKCIGTFGVTKEITALKKLEIEATEKAEQLLAQEEELRQNLEEMQATQEESGKKQAELSGILAAISTAFLVSEYGINGQIINANADFATSYNVPHNQVLGMTYFDLASRCGMQLFEVEQIWDQLKRAEIVKAVTLLKINGQDVWLNQTFAPILNQDGVVYKILNIGIDISETKRQEKQVEQNQKLLINVLNEIPEKIFLKDNNGRFVIANKQVAANYNRSVEEILGKSDFDFYPQELAQDYFNHEQDIINSGQLQAFEEGDPSKFDGLIVRSLKKPFFIESLGVTGLFGVQFDISDIKRKEYEAKKLAEEVQLVTAQLQKEQYLMDALMDTMPDAIYFKDKQSKFIKLSKSLQDKHGTDNLIGKSDFDFFSIEHAQQAFDDEQRIIETGEPIIDFIEKETFEDGRVEWVSTTKMPLRDHTGAVVGTFGISRGVTNIMTLELKAEQNREMVDVLADKLPILIYETDKGKLITKITGSGLKTMGRKQAELIGKPISELLGADASQLGKIEKEGKPVIISISGKDANNKWDMQHYVYKHKVISGAYFGFAFKE